MLRPARRHARRPFRAAALVGLALLLIGPVVPAEGDPPLRLERTIPLPGVSGRIDHLALEPGGKRLAVAALGSDSVEVVDLERGAVAHRIEGVGEPQGVLFPAAGRLVVTSGDDGSVRTFAAPDWAPAGRIDLAGDADNVRQEAATGRVLVGYGEGGIAILDGERKVGDLRLPGHPESFQLEAKGSRVFVNVPGAGGSVVVLDRQAGRTITTWTPGDARSNFPMALDEAHGRLFVGCRRPSRLVVIDTADGKVRASVEISADVDDVWLDAPSGRLLLSCGEGSIDVLQPGEGDAWTLAARVATASGARTSLFDPTTDRLYLAVPRRGAAPAEVRVYSVVRPPPRPPAGG